jgi:excisionase family DNA binding protein|tara:strand:- start:375 stop:578 length:204 start_codon:yes stop_codon:yes gene_type:complete
MHFPKLTADTLLSSKEMALIYGFSKKTLENHRAQRVGIPYIKIGRMVRYRKSDVDQYLEQHRITFVR